MTYLKSSFHWFYIYSSPNSLALSPRDATAISMNNQSEAVLNKKSRPLYATVFISSRLLIVYAGRDGSHRHTV